MIDAIKITALVGILAYFAYFMGSDLSVLNPMYILDTFIIGVTLGILMNTITSILEKRGRNRFREVERLEASVNTWINLCMKRLKQVESLQEENSRLLTQVKHIEDLQLENAYLKKQVAKHTVELFNATSRYGGLE